MFSIRHNIMKKKHMDKAAKHWLPIYVGLMSAVFAIYLLLKGLKPLLKSLLTGVTYKSLSGDTPEPFKKTLDNG